MSSNQQEINHKLQLPTYQFDHRLSPYFNNTTRLVLGTSGLGGVWGEINNSKSIDAILFALENGIDAFDTAPSYADAENVLGEALLNWKGEKPFISTKVGRLRGENAHDFNLDYSSDGIMRSLEKSLKKLHIDQVDLLFLHEPQLVPNEQIPRILELLQCTVEEGMVSRLGIGGNLTESFKPYMGKEKFEVISGFLRMNACNLDAFMNEIQFVKKKEVAYYNASILHFGLLGTRLEQYKENFDQESNWLKARDIKIAGEVKFYAEELDMPLAELCQRYVFGIGESDRIVVGAKNLEQIKRTIQDWKSGPLPKEQFDHVTNIIIKNYQNYV